MKRRPNVGLLLGNRPRRWPNSKTTLGRHPMFAVMCVVHGVYRPTQRTQYIDAMLD